MVKLIDIELLQESKIRKQALEIFKSLGIPSAKVEEWKYTKPKDLNADDFVLESKNIAKNFHKWSSEFEIDSYKIEFLNGKLISIDEKLQSKIFIKPICEKKEISPLETENRFVALNTALFSAGVLIKIPKNMELDKPIAIINKTCVANENLLSNIRNIIKVEDFAKATLIEHFCYSGDVKSVYFNNIVNEILVSANAHLKHYKFQDESFKANHISYSLVQVLENGKYDSVLFQKGANLSRCETKVLLKEVDAIANLDALYNISGWASIDTTTYVEHLSKKTFSNQVVKGVIDGNAKGIFQGKITIAKDAIHTIGNQMHRAMLLSDTAEVDCKPELEIFADDVKCSHGATSGVIDEDMLFYMCSRGINIEVAKKILIEAYLDEIISKIDDNDIYNWTKEFIK